jgi:predicted nucleic acid-binding protein
VIAPPLTAGVVSDTGPVNYLLQIGQIDLLQGLFGLVWVPKAVMAELMDRGAPDRVQSWVECPPAWFAVTEFVLTTTASGRRSW